jgi:CheY-like chemotaxis protein
MKVTDSSPLKGLSILCIDNHIDSLEVLRLTLQLEGAQVHTATSADGAIFALKKSPVDVVISDLLMPDENGIEVLRKIRVAGYFGPAIALTGVRDDIVQLGALRQGFTAYLRKPVEPEHLIATIKKAVSLQTAA